VRYIGASNFSGWHLMKALWAADRCGFPQLVCQEIHHTLYSREAENELIPIGVDQGLGTLVWSPLAGGLLSGKYFRGQAAPEGSRHTGDWNEPPVHDEDTLYEIIDVLREIGKENGVSAAQVSLAYSRSRPWVTSLVVGFKNEKQLVDNLASSNVRLTQDEVQMLEKASRRHLQYPYWHQATSIADRMGPADLILHGGHRF
jgi:aryl-alcohol dehydrogenase-like predicted oxidoreductase